MITKKSKSSSAATISVQVKNAVQTVSSKLCARTWLVTASAAGMILTNDSLADSLTADFNIRNGVSGSVSGGHLTYVLKPNGTISAQLIWVGDAGGTGVFYGFGADATFYDEQSHFSPGLGSTGGITSWTEITNSNEYLMGFFGELSGSHSWIIGSPGEFSSVAQAISGNGSPYDFYVESDDASDPLVFAEWNANAVITNASVPETNSYAIVIAGVSMMAFGVARRRKFRRS